MQILIIRHASAQERSAFPATGKSDDLAILGSRTLEGLNLMVDPVGKRLVDSGPAPAAAISFAESCSLGCSSSTSNPRSSSDE